MKLIYLDNSATTPVDPRVFTVMKPFFSKKFGNPSEYHSLGLEARAVLENARQKVADFLGADSGEIIFSSGATESINLSHKGLMENMKKAHIITTSIEHKAVLETIKHLDKKTTYLKVNKYGEIDINDLKKAITPQTALISVMYVNNEVGTIQPIKEIGAFIKDINKSRKQKIYFHTDATQAVSYLDCRVKNLGVDFLSLTGHKIYAPKGVGVLYARLGTPLVRQMDGGSQENRMRAGTENVPSIVGLGKAMELIDTKKTKTSFLRDKLIKGILKINGVILTGHPAKRAPHIASFIVEGVEGEAMVLRLSSLGIIISTGSACTSSELSASHVLTAMGYPPEISHGSIRFSLGKDTMESDINYVLKVFPKIVKDLRAMAPKL